MNPDLLIWVGGGLIGLATVLATVISTRRTNQAKARLDEVSAYSKLFRDLQERNAQLEARANLQDKQITALYRELNQLRALLVRNGIPLPQEA